MERANIPAGEDHSLRKVASCFLVCSSFWEPEPTTVFDSARSGMIMLDLSKELARLEEAAFMLLYSEGSRDAKFMDSKNGAASTGAVEGSFSTFSAV